MEEIGENSLEDPTPFLSLNTKGVSVACIPTQNYKNTVVL